MLERVLKTLLAIMLIVFFVQKVVHPAFMEADAAKKKLAEVSSALRYMASPEQKNVRNILLTEEKMIFSQTKQMNSLLPDFQTARVEAVTRLEILREKFNGTWKIQPSTVPLTEEKVVRWPVKLSYDGDFASVVKILNSLENDGSLNRFVSLDLASTKTGSIEMTANLEMLFRNSKPYLNIGGTQ